MTNDLPKFSERHPAGIEGMWSVAGATVSGPGGWHRRDAIFIGDKEVGAVHVREAHGRISALTECQGEFVMGKDVEWIARKCFYVPPMSPARQVLHAQGWPVRGGAAQPEASQAFASASRQARQRSARP
jgi:hypothetical protein